MDNMFSKKKVLLIITIIILFLSVGYSAFNSSLFFEDILAFVRVKANIRITGISVESTNNMAISQGEEYNVNSIKTTFILPEAVSSITYKLKITNFEAPEMGIYQVTGLPNYLDYDFVNYEEKSKICDNNNNCSLGIAKDDILLTIKYKDQTITPSVTNHNIELKFDFREFYTITYTNITNNGYPIEIIDGDTLKVKFIKDIPNNINVYVDGVKIDRSLYEYQNNSLTVENVSGNLLIENAGSVLVIGNTFNKRLKDLANNTTNATYNTADKKITYIGFYKEKLPVGYTKEMLESLPNISLSEDNIVKAYNDNGNIYIYSNNNIIANKNMDSMFRNMQSITNIDLAVLDTSDATSMCNMFYGANKLTNLDLSSFNTSNVTNMSFMFHSTNNLTSLDLSSFDTSNVTNMNSMFYGVSKLTSLDLSSFNTSNVTNMSNMFYTMKNLTNLDLSSFNTSNVTNMYNMFNGMNNLTNLNLSSFNTSNVTNMSFMFSSMINLTNLDLSSFNTSNVTNMNSMFYNMRNLTSLDLSSFNTSNVTGMSNMFQGMSSLTSLDLSSFNTSNVTNMYYMFYSVNKLTSLDLSSFNTSNVTNMSAMFNGMNYLKTVYVSDKWTTANVIDSGQMFNSVNMIVGGNGTKYNASYIDKTYARIDTENTPGYFTYKEYSL